MHKTLTFAVFERGHGRQPYHQYFGEADSQTQTHDLLFWWKALAIVFLKIPENFRKRFLTNDC